MTEQMMVELAKEGRSDALEQIYLQNRDRIFRLALRYLRSPEDAEDVVQETFIKAFDAISGFDLNLGSGLPAWINQICVHCAIDHLRVRKRRWGRTTSLDAMPQDPPSSNPSPEQVAIGRGIRRRVQDAVGILSPRQRAIFSLRYVDQLDIRQIADQLDCSEGNVRAHLFRSASKLKGLFLSES
ncbi:MAG: RNA polymerase sigma factor [Candidatus Aminicenantes bacterium]|nr:RNA polymerase sigma factor [Candidatus Aminicenantes bacterium]